MDWTSARKGALFAASMLAAISAVAPAAADSTAGSDVTDPLAPLVAAAKEEGELTIIAMPHDWCGYGQIIADFKAKYGLVVNEINPDAGSGDEIEAIKANRGNTGPQAPDVIDVGLSFGPSAKAEGLLQPYKVSTWDGIPDDLKDPEGYWYGGYYGVLAFEINVDMVKKVPTDWPDLLADDYRNMVALAGDPRASNEAIQGVFAAGLSMTNGDVDKAPEAGLNFFAELNQRGNFVPVVGGASSLAQGTPIIIRWDYLGLTDRETLAGNPRIMIVVPQTGVVAGVYVQAISAYAPHPNAAKLWMEHLYSDEGQLAWLKGYCHPVRFRNLVADNKVPIELLENLPPAKHYETALFPTLEQQSRMKEIVTRQWDRVVGANVQ